MRDFMALYIIDDEHRIVKTHDLLEWGRALESGNRIVAQTDTPNGCVSTVFLGIDHGILDDGPPILFETMVFGGTHDLWRQRYATWGEAERGHEVIVKRMQMRIAN